MPILRRSRYLVEIPPVGPVHAAATDLPRPRGGGREFARFARGVETQLATTPGALAYSLQRTVFGGRFWTLSLWVDPVSMARFVGSGVHAEAATWLRGRDLGGGKVTNWSMRIPVLDWEEAYRRLGTPRPEGRVIQPPGGPPPGWANLPAGT